MSPSSAPSRNLLPAIGALLLAASTLQFGSALAAMTFDRVDPLGISAWRLWIAAIVLLVITRPKVHRWNRDQWLASVWLGLSLGAMNVTFYQAIERLPIGIAVSIEFLGPLTLSAVLSKRARDFIWIGLAFVAMVLLAVESFVGVSSLDLWGVAFALAAGACWALYIIAGTNAGAKIEGTGGLAVAFAVSAVAAVPFGGVAALAAFGSGELVAIMVAVAMLASVIPFTLEYYAMRRVPKPVYGVLTSLEPAVATAFGWLILHQVAGPLRLLSMLLVIGASVGITLGARKVVEVDLDPGPGTDTAPITLPILPSRLQANARETHRLVKQRTAYKRRVGGIAGARARASRAMFLEPGMTTEAIPIIQQRAAEQQRSAKQRPDAAASGEHTSSPVTMNHMANVTLEGSTTINLAHDLPAVGSKAPDFTLVGTDLEPVKLSDFAGKRVVLNIFPSIDTGVCAASVRRFNELAAGFDNTVVVCVSADLPFAQERFCGAEGIENVVSASTFRSSFGNDYGVLMVDGPLEALLARAVVVIDTDGTVRHVELVPEIGQEPDYDAAKAALSA